MTNYLDRQRWNMRLNISRCISLSIIHNFRLVFLHSKKQLPLRAWRNNHVNATGMEWDVTSSFADWQIRCDCRTHKYFVAHMDCLQVGPTIACYVMILTKHLLNNVECKRYIYCIKPQFSTNKIIVCTRACRSS